MSETYPRHYPSRDLPWGDFAGALSPHALRDMTLARTLIGVIAHRIAGGNSAASARHIAQRYYRTLSSAPRVLASEAFVSAMKQLHATLSGQERFPSALRKHDVFCSAPHPDAPQYYVDTRPEMIERALSDLGAAVFSNKDIDKFERAWLVNYELLFIHPFDDGNGRLARAVLATMLQQAFGVPITLDASRSMRSTFAQHNLLLRTPRSGATYVRWNQLLDGLLQAEFQMLKQLVIAIGGLSQFERGRVLTLFQNVVEAAGAGEAADEIVADELRRANNATSFVLRSAFG